jgi:hypothetical protein
MSMGRRRARHLPSPTWRPRRTAAAAVAAPERAPIVLGVTVRSAVTFAVLAVVLLAPWPRYGRAVSAALGLYGNAVIAVTGVGGDARPRFSVSARGTSAPDANDWTVWLGATQGPAAAQPPVQLEMRILGYTPLALLLALTLASDGSRRRRLKMLAIGWALLLSRLALAIALPVGRAFGGARSPAGPLTEIVWYVVVDLPAMSYVAPLLAWWIGYATTRD